MMDISKCSTQELNELIVQAQAELSNRKNDRFEELCKHFIDLAFEIKKEFPWADFTISPYCEQCRDNFDINVFDYLEQFSMTNFRF